MAYLKDHPDGSTVLHVSPSELQQIQAAERHARTCACGLRSCSQAVARVLLRMLGSAAYQKGRGKQLTVTVDRTPQPSTQATAN
jgi:hypothetical protein